MSWLKPKVRDINPETVGNYFDQGGYVQEMGNLSRDLRDPNSEYNQGVLDNIRRGTEDSLFKRAIVNRRAAAASGGIGQSGILQQLQEQNINQAYDNMIGAFNQGMGANLDRSTTLLGQAAQLDVSKGEAMASAYGQNITNKNNANSAFAGNLMNLGSGIASAAIMTSDKRKKENIKKVGKAKTKNGKSVNLYSYNFKGSKKKNVGVIAQEIEKSHPKAVKKQKNGMLMVNYKELFA